MKKLKQQDLVGKEKPVMYIIFTECGIKTLTAWSYQGTKKCLSPFSELSYESYLNIYAGVTYRLNSGIIESTVDHEAKMLPSIVVFNDKKYEFKPGQPLIIEFEAGEKHIPASECEVVLEQNEYGRYYRIIITDDCRFVGFNGHVYFEEP